jgi:phosphate-selective porin
MSLARAVVTSAVTLALAAPSAWAGSAESVEAAPAAAGAAPAGPAPAAAQPPRVQPTPAEAEASGLRLSWKDGKTTLETDDVRIQLSNRIQLRYTRDAAGADGPRGFFELRRAKTKLEGWLYSSAVGYGLQLNWADTSNPLEDAYLDYDVSGSEAVGVTLGQYKVPFGRQELTSSGSQQFVDRSIVSKAFAHGRDLGVQVHGRALGGKLEWRTGAFNGNGRTRQRDAADRYQLNARVQLAPNGDTRYSESDFESKGTPLYSVTVGIQRRDLDDDDAIKTVRTTYALDGVLKYRGFSAFVEAFFASDDPAEAAQDPRSPGGFHLQLGQLLADRRFELALRFARLDPDRRAPGDSRSEIGAALGYYVRKHGLKAQADVRRVEDDASGDAETQFRFQTQFVF